MRRAGLYRVGARISGLSGAGQWGIDGGGCHGKVEEVEGDGMHQGMMLHHLQPLLMCHDCSPLLHPGLYKDIHIHAS